MQFVILVEYAQHPVLDNHHTRGTQRRVGAAQVARHVATHRRQEVHTEKAGCAIQALHGWTEVVKRVAVDCQVHEVAVQCCGGDESPPLAGGNGRVDLWVAVWRCAAWRATRAADLAPKDGDDAFGEHLGEVHECIEHEDAVCSAAALVVEYGQHGAVERERVVTSTATVKGKMARPGVGWCVIPRRKVWWE